MSVMPQKCEYSHCCVSYDPFAQMCNMSDPARLRCFQYLEYLTESRERREGNIIGKELSPLELSPEPATSLA